MKLTKSVNKAVQYYNYDSLKKFCKENGIENWKPVATGAYNGHIVYAILVNGKFVKDPIFEE